MNHKQAAKEYMLDSNSKSAIPLIATFTQIKLSII